MKKHALLLILVIFCLSGNIAQTAKSRYLKPLKNKQTETIIISGKSKVYYPLSEQQTSVIIVSGPGKLQVLTRAHFLPEQKKQLSYSLVYTLDGGKQKTITEKAIDRSEKASFQGKAGETPGQLQSFDIQLGPGSHTLEFKLNTPGVPVSARYKFVPATVKKKDWVPFSPLQPSEPVDLVTKEEIVEYYRFSSATPLRLEVSGPTKIQVLSRFENHFQMKGAIMYRLQIKENGQVLNTFQLSARPSEITSYKNNEKLIPGKACEIMINVPKGNHVYEIIPLDQDKNTLLGRLLIPKKDAH